MSQLTQYRKNYLKSVPKKILNSYLTPRFLYNRLYTQLRWQRIISQAPNSSFRKRTSSHNQFGKLVSSIARKIFWFWPHDDEDVAVWINAQIGDIKEYPKYIDKKAEDYLFCDLVETYCSDKKVPLLELGCNVGRVIDELISRGYSNIRGVELNINAIKASRSVFGQEVANCIECNAIQPYLIGSESGSFEYIITFGATIELIHPAFDVINHMCRVARKRIVIYINENLHTYPRFYTKEFARWGFYNIYYQKAIGDITGSDTQNSLMVFERV